ncbi:MAG: ribonuclease Y [Patescibacteria group bacterium]|jgi:ribonuclease Y
MVSKSDNNDLQASQLNISSREEKFLKREKEIEELKSAWEEKVNQASGLTPEEAKKIVLEKVEKELTSYIARRVKEAEEEIKLTAEEKARQILVDEMQHGVTDIVAEYTVSSIKIPSEEIKGKVIGREGRNIRIFERLTGVDVSFEEEGEIRLSSFDSLRREVARRALEKLIRDGRIQPPRIEEVVRQTKEEVEKIVFEAGRELCDEAGVYHLAPDLVSILGRFKFRFSFGQNMIVHTLEETKIGVALAHELKADVEVVRLGCLLHDIGKVVTEKEGSHVQLGVELLKKYGLPEKVINCVAEHHEDKPFSTVESVITWIADAASGSRPGARYEAHEDYVKRMTRIEEIAKSFAGVADVAAYQAGREVLVMVKPEEISDNEAKVLAYKIAQKLEKEADYLGQIKVTVIREVREEITLPAEG